MYQLNALLYKNTKIQLKTKFLTLCQFSTPIICIFLMYVIIMLINDKIDNIETGFFFGAVVPINFEFDKNKVPAIIKNVIPNDYFDMLKYYNRKINLNINLNNNKQNNYIFDYKSKTHFNGAYLNMIKNDFKNSNEMNDLVKKNLDDIYNLTLKNLNNSNDPFDGNFLIEDFNSNKIKATIQANDYFYMFYHKINGFSGLVNYVKNVTNLIIFSTESFVNSIDFLSNALLSLNGKPAIKTILFDYKLSNVFKNTLLDTVNILELLFFPIALGLCLPIILQFITMEKEEKIKAFLEINGMNYKYYWLTNYLFFVIFQIIIYINFIIFGYLILGNQMFFKYLNIFDFTVANIGYILCNTSLSFVLLRFIKSSGSGNSFGFVFSFIGIFIANGVHLYVYPIPKSCPILLLFYPHINLTRMIYQHLNRSYSLLYLNNYNLYNSDYIACLIIIYGSAIIYVIIGLILNEEKIQNNLKFLFKSKLEIDNTVNDNLKTLEEDFENICNKELIDSYYNLHKDTAKELINVNKLMKVYHSKSKTVNALKGVSLSIKPEEVLGLLGPNGAGKTTMISIICKFQKQSYGSVNFNNISYISFCPQFDVLWPEMTILEHLIFFSKLRNSYNKSNIDNILNKVSLYDARNKKVKELSGGMKRRVSIAISIVGEPSMVILDEPSTGLDPKKRRELWQIINNIKTFSTVLLSTHLMEEAENISDNIAIVTNGLLRAIGTTKQLKEIYCNFYIIQIEFVQEDIISEDRLLLDLKNIGDSEKIYKFRNFIKIKLTKNNINLSDIIKVLEVNDYNIKSWNIDEGDLEDVFENIKKKYD